ncbi:MAG: hypothetical protein JNG88_04190 [Phycisphaerales bacterium]|nr:hypothetical protein [Phycisphaerales bacterium]
MNPLVWLHYRLVGSTNALIFVGIFALLVIGGAGISYRMAPAAQAGQVSSVWLAIITVGQALFLGIAMPAAVRKAVLRDFQTGMIESHRLSPLSGFTLISGYLMGAPVQIWMLYGMSLLFGTLFSAHYGYSLGVTTTVPAWYFLQACLLVLTFMITTLVLLIALGTSGKANIIGVIAMISVFGGWVVVGVVPGLALLIGLMSADAMYYSVTKGQVRNAETVLIAAIVQAAFGTLYFMAAARKVRVPERAMFSVTLGTILAVLSGATLAAGFQLAPGSSTLFADWKTPPEIQVILSAGVLLLICYVPLISAAVDAALADRVRSFGEPINASLRRFLSFMPIVLAMIALVALINMHDGGIHSANPLDEYSPNSIRFFRVMTVVAIGLSFWTDYQLLYATAVIGRKPFVTVLLSVVILKVAPILLDVPIFIMAQEQGNRNALFSTGYFSGASPIGTVMLLLLPGGRPIGGLIVQVLFALAATLLAFRARGSLAPIAAPLAQPIERPPLNSPQK